MQKFKIKRKILCELLLNSSKRSFSCISNYISEFYSELSKSQKNKVINHLRRDFWYKFNNRVKKTRKVNVFLEKHSEWLKGEIYINIDAKRECSTTKKRGRPLKKYEDCSKRSKKNKNKVIWEKVSEQQISDIYNSYKNIVEKVTEIEALALYLDMNLTKKTYIQLKKFNDIKLQVESFYPSYYLLLLSKKFMFL